MSLTTRQSRMLGTSDGAAASVAPAVLLPMSVWTQQPQQAVGIDPALGPAFAWVASNRFAEIVTGGPVIDYTSGFGAVKCDRGGVAFDLGALDGAKRLHSPSVVSPGSSFVAVVMFKNTSATTSGILLAGKTYWSQANGFMFASKTNTDTLELNGGSGGTFPTISAPGVGVLDGKIRTVAVRYRGTSADVCMDGRFLGTVSLGTAAGTWPSGIGIGNYATTTNLGHPPSRQFYMAAVVRNGDPVSLSANPWQIFKPLNRQIWVAA